MVNTRKLGFWTGVALVVGCVIGSGVFVKPGRVLAATGDSNLAILAWALGGLMTLAGGLTIAEIASRIPKNGGITIYIEELFGPKLGFVSGWVQALIYGPALASALALYFGSLFCQFVGLPSADQKVVGLMALFGLGLVSAIGTRVSAVIQNISTVVKLIPIFVIVCAGLWLGRDTIFSVQVPVQAGAGPSLGLAAAVLATLWAYDGWVQVGNLGEEMQNASKNLPRAIIIGLLTIMITYLLVNLALFRVLPKDQIALLNEKAVGVAAETMFGSIGGKLVSLGILISIFGCLNGNILAGTRVPYAMATRGTFPFRSLIGKQHAKLGTPVPSILLVLAIAAGMVIMLNPDRITDIAIFSMYGFYALLCFALFRVRKIYGKPGKGQYRVPLYPVVPIVAAFSFLYICWTMASNSPKDAILSVVVALFGYPLYLILDHPKRKAAKAAAALRGLSPSAEG